MKPLDTEKEDSDDKLNEPLIKHFVEELDEDQKRGCNHYRFDIIERGLQSAA